MALKRAADNIDKNVVTLQRRIETIEAVCVIVPLLFMILRNSGTWHVYRTELDEHGNYMGKREEVGTTELDEFADNAGRGLEMGKYYRYEVVHHEASWPALDIPSEPAPLTTVHAAEVRASTVPVIPMHLVQDDKIADKIKMDWNFGNVPKSEHDVTFKVHRIEPSGAITRNYQSVTVARNAGKASFTDDKPESNCSVYGYFVQLDLMEGKVHLYSDTVYAHVLEGSSVTYVNATKGTGGNDVVVTWKAKQVGTSPTLFAVQRRFIDHGEWVTIHERRGTEDTYTYTDNKVETGRYYSYRVVAYLADCDKESSVISNSLSDVGYAQATGVVSGRVQFNTGTAVDNVRLTLSRESDEQSRAPYYSRHIIDDDEGLTWKTDTTTANKMLSLSKPFTIQMWVNPDENMVGTYLFSIQGHEAHPYNNTDGYSVWLRSSTQGYALTVNTSAGAGREIAQFVKVPEIMPGRFTHITLRNNGKGLLE